MSEIYSKQPKSGDTKSEQVKSGAGVVRVMRTGDDGGVPTGGTLYYEGSWKSAVFSWLVAHGTVAAEVNYDTKSAKILLRYDGAFKKGTTEQLETKMVERKDTGGVSDALSYVFAITGGKAKIQFTAKRITRHQIAGAYKASGPRDNGEFIMNISSQQKFQDFAQNAGLCAVQ